MKKRILALFLGAVMTANLVGCAGSNTDWSKYVTLGQYTGIEVEKVDTTVTDEEVQEQIDYLLESKAEKKEITGRPVQNGDIVNIDYEGKLDGVAFDGGTAQGSDLTIGSGNFISGFEDGLIGKNIGETTDLNISFPDPYPNNPDLAGKPVVFTVKINSISESVLPELSDAFVQDISDVQTVDEYKAQLKTSLEEQKSAQGGQQQISTLWQTVVQNSEIKKYPKNEIKKSVDETVKSIKQAAKDSDTEFEEYLQTNYNLNEESFMESVNEQTESMIGERVIARAIAQKENITVSDAEYKEGVSNYATQYSMDSAAFEEKYGKDRVKEQVLWDKVLEFIKENAVIK